MPDFYYIAISAPARSCQWQKNYSSWLTCCAWPNHWYKYGDTRACVLRGTEWKLACGRVTYVAIIILRVICTKTGRKIVYHMLYIQYIAYAPFNIGKKAHSHIFVSHTQLFHCSHVYATFLMFAKNETRNKISRFSHD